MRRIQVTERRAIGDGEPPFIVAEIGNNHNGDVDIARRLVEEAKNRGADAVKFQTKNIETAFSRELLDSPYAGPNSFGQTYREHKQFLELSEADLRALKDLADSLHLVCFSSPFDPESVDLLERVGVPLYKIASFHLTQLDLIERVCKTRKPILISTGMSTLQEIDAAVELIRKYSEDFVLLQCTSNYPTETVDLNLRVIHTLRERYDCLVGLSSHERGVGASPGAVLLGASVIERHFTLDRAMKGPDHAASLEPYGLELLVRRSRTFYLALGGSEKAVLDSELDNRMKFRGY